jgi:multidrug efflux pump subunit AcrA (membrane-fusion protein)
MRARPENTEKLDKQMRQSVIVFVIVIAVVALGVCILMTRLYSGAMQSPGSYSTTRLVVGAYSGTIECTGSVEPIHSSDVYQDGNATITAVMVKEGDHVRRGHALYEVETAEGTSTTVTADASGTVANLKIQPGMTGDNFDANVPVLQIVDSNVLVGIIQVPENAASLIKTDQEVSTLLTADQVSANTGIITEVSSVPSSKRTQDGQLAYDATLMFDDDEGLQIGAQVVAKVLIQDYGQVYYVSATAVKVQDGIAFVDIVYTKGTIEEHQVQLLGTNDDGSKIIKGDVLADGTTIRADLGE